MNYCTSTDKKKTLSKERKNPSIMEFFKKTTFFKKKLWKTITRHSSVAKWYKFNVMWSWSNITWSHICHVTEQIAQEMLLHILCFINNKERNWVITITDLIQVLKLFLHLFFTQFPKRWVYNKKRGYQHCKASDF